jgi:hypothetical protein
MTSNINPNDIDGAYPVAGQDNNSQGFRTNFTNTRTNFQYAADELTDLQNKAVLKAALTGTTLNNDMQGSVLSNAQLQNMTQTVVALGTLSGSVTVNYALGSYQTVTTNGSISLGFSNLPAAGAEASVVVQITVASTAHTVTLPTAVSVNNAGIQGINTSTNVITFAATGVYSFQFITSNGGTTITVTEANKQIQPFNASSELLADGAASSLGVTAEYFTTTGASTATLAAGVAGQVKTYMMVATAGNMVITVTNAGWKASGTGTMTFSARGQGCTLQYINSKWFCIGNNGVAFA